MNRQECLAALADEDDFWVCDGTHQHRWEISPNPYTNDLDTYVCDTDEEARRALIDLAEKLWDSADAENGEQTIKFKLNDVPALGEEVSR